MKKIIIGIIFIILLINFKVVSVHAANSPANNYTNNYPIVPSIEQYKEILKNAQKTGQASQETWVYQVGYNVILSVSDYLLCLYSCDKKNSSAPSPSGLQGMLAAGVGTLYAHAPASGVEYIANLKNNFGIGTPVYASKGTDLLDTAVFYPWQKFRNVSYVFFVVILVAIGFMVMFRFKINPQTVASIQDSLPRIIVALVLVTLSYAIAGLMIDLAWVGNWLIENTVSDSGLIFGLKNADFKTMPNQIWDPVAKALIKDPLSAAPTLLGTDFPSAWPFDILNNYGGTGIVGVVLGAISTIVGAGGAGLASAIFGLILAFTVVGATFKIFFSLLTKYVTLVVMTMFLPFAFLWGSLPGQEDTSNKAIMTMLSAALSFPAVTLFLALAYYFSKLPPIMVIQEIPPLYYLAPFAEATKSSSISVGNNLIAIGLLTLIPSIPQIIDDVLQVKGGGALGAGTQELGSQLKKIPIIGSFIG